MQLLKKNHFELLDQPPAFRIDLAQLERAFRTLQATVHPDRFVNHPPAERRLAIQLATMANEAWQCLRDPIQRAVYLLQLRGLTVDPTSRSGFEPGFLMQQMTWRETLEAIGHEPDLGSARSRLRNEVVAERDRLVAELEQLIDIDRLDDLAASRVRQLMFVERFLEQIEAIGDDEG